MRLQLALDGTFQDSIEVLKQVQPYVDIAEIGTPLIFREGLGAARKLRNLFPNITLLADLKIMDAGEEEAALAFEAGCDIVTVLGAAHDRTVQGVVKAAQRYHTQVMVDMIQVSDLAGRARRLLELGCDYLCIHTAYDLQGEGDSPLADLQHLRSEFPDCPLVAAGGIKLETIDAVAVLKPEIIVVGGAITRAVNPAQAASRLREWINAYGDLR